MDRETELITQIAKADEAARLEGLEPERVVLTPEQWDMLSRWRGKNHRWVINQPTMIPRVLGLAVEIGTEGPIVKEQAI